MDDALAIASRSALLLVGVGGSLAMAWAAVRHRLGWATALAGALILLQFAWPVEPTPSVHPALAFMMLVPWFIGFPLLAATFPDGRFVPRWSLWVLGASLAVLLVNLAVGDAMRMSDLWWIVPAVQTLVGVTWIAYRYRRSATTAERESVRWVLLGVIITVTAFQVILVVDGNIGAGGPLDVAKANAACLPLMLGLVIGSVWPRLWNVDAAFRAILVILGTGWGLGGVYAAGSVMSRAVGVDAATAAAAGTVAVAIAAYPLVRLSMRIATWLVYRERLGESAAVARMAAELDADDGRSVAQRVVDVARVATGSAAARIEAVSSADAAVIDAVAGDSAASGESFAIALRGELLATLVVAPRRGESELSARDRAAMAALARHVGPALAGARALREATTAQTALVTAREEERRDLRRELHDDLGPALSGLALSAAAIAMRADDVAPELAASARELQIDIADAVGRAREISHGLRPALLEDSGLEAALRERIDADVDLQIGDLGDLPAAVDLAALRIVQEAVANVRRHAAASTCRVVVDRDAAGLRVEIVDDGIGMPKTVAPGLGLRSIRERASELGGRSRIEGAAGGGTVVSVWLPIGGAS